MRPVGSLPDLQFCFAITNQVLRFATEMRFHGIMVVRDEADVLAEVLTSHLSWADTFSICDHASSDGTSEIIESFSRAHPSISHIREVDGMFSNGLRAKVFEQVRRQFAPGDWVVIADADEMFHVPPPQFVQEYISPNVGSVHSLHLDFALTVTEADALEDPVYCLAQRKRPIVERRTKFAYSPFGEFRLFRYRNGMAWSPSKYEPRMPGLLADERIPVRHYRARDPLQLQARCKIRTQMGRIAGHHWNLDWRDLLCADDAELLEWMPGMGLPEPVPSFSVPRNTQRFCRDISYRFGLVRMLEILRTGVKSP